MPSASKIKGSGFEREIAKYLSDLYGESFVRAAHSGAFVGGTNQTRKESLSESQIRGFKGDIIPGDSFSLLNVECKFYGDFAFHSLFTGKHSQLDKWLEQLLDAADEGDLSVLFMKFNRRGRYVAVQAALTWVTDFFFFYGSKKYGDWYIMEMETFFRLNKDLFKAYSGTTPQLNTDSNNSSTDTKSNPT
jgi:hypothetical protein